MKSYVAPFVFALAVACAGSGESCSGCDGLVVAPYPTTPLPGGEVQTDVVRARLTTSALNFFRKHLDLLLGEFLVIQNGRAKFVLSPSMLPPGAILLRTGSSISFDLEQLKDNLSFEWLDGSSDASGNNRPGLRFLIEDVELFADLRMAANFGDPINVNVACHVRDEGQLAALTVGRLGFDIRLTVDSSSGLPRLAGATENLIAQIGNASSQPLNLAASACSPFASGADGTCNDSLCACDGACTTNCATGEDPKFCACQDWCDLIDLLGDASGVLSGLINPLLDALKPTVAGFVSEGLIGALSALPLRLETELPLADLLGSAFAGASPLALKITPAPGMNVSGDIPGRGLDIGLNGGITAVAQATCAQGSAALDLTGQVGPPPLYSGFVEIIRPNGNSHIEAYHVAMSASQALFSQAFWAIYQSGMLCTSLDAYDVEGLVGDTFSFTAGLLQTFDNALDPLASPTSPIMVTLRPRGPPALRLGAGRQIAVGVRESLMEVTLDDMELGIYLLVDDAPERVTGLTADIIVKLGVERTPDQALEVVVEGIEVSDIRDDYNELAPGADIGGLVALVADLALDTFLGDNLRFRVAVDDMLSSALGLPIALHVNAVRRDLGPTNASHLSLYATLCDETDQDDSSNLACYVNPATGGRTVRALSVNLLDTESLYVPSIHAEPRWLMAPSGSALLRLQSTDTELLEFQTRVDGSVWSHFRMAQENGTLWVHHPRLYALGQHTVEVRARRLNEPRSQSDIARTQFWVDRELPKVWIQKTIDAIEVYASDIGSRDDVEIFARTSENNPWLALPSKRLPTTGITGDVEFVARDRAGNTSLPLHVSVQTPASMSPNVAVVRSTTAGGCSASGAATWLVGLLVLLPLSRRRRSGYTGHQPGD